jgi:uroporphyrinogen-III synthase
MTAELDVPTPNGLAGMVIGVPAARRSAETARLIERWGGTPLAGPTVEEVEIADPAPVIQATREVIDAGASWSVHLTGVGTKRWFAIADEHRLLQPLLATLRRAQVVARGQKASTVLRKYDLEPAWVPEGETSREIAGWMKGRVAAGDLVALQRHGERVPTLTDFLSQAGARVVELATYHWEIPADREPANHLTRELAGGRVHALVITSAPQVRNLFKVAEELGLDQELQEALQERVFLASVGQVASVSLHERGLTADLEARPPRLGALVRSLALARDEVLGKRGSGTAVRP